MNCTHLMRLGTIAIISLLLIGLAQPALADLPPRTTPTSVSSEPPAPSAPGSWIELRVQFPATWPWNTLPWNLVWTVVQWQDAAGNWYTVEGWQGALDEMVKTEGVKTWWVGRADWGKGPFRWLVYERWGGRLLAQSTPFKLPSAQDQKIKVEVSLEP